MLSGPWSTKGARLFASGLLAAHCFAVSQALAAPDETWVTQTFVEEPLVSSHLKDEVEAALSAYGASLAVDGHTALVSASQFAVDASTSGNVFVFERGPLGWVEREPALPPEGRRGFGYSVALSDGFYAIGASDETAAGAAPVRVVERATGAGEDLPLPPGVALTIAFGRHLAMVGDTLFVSDSHANDGSGAVVVYRFLGGHWSFAQVLPQASDELETSGALFGLALAATGNTLVVGAPYASNPNGTGAVYVFRRASAADAFAFDSVSSPATPAGSATFGSNLALDPGSNALAIADTGYELEAGVVYLYPGTVGSWSAPPEVLRSFEAGEIGDYELFGSGLAFARGTLLAGAPGHAVGDESGVMLAFSNVQPGWPRGEPLSSVVGMGNAVAGSVAGVALTNAAGAVYAYTLRPGAPCESAFECQGGFCVDGVCCESRCDGVCETCAPAGSCNAIAEGDDPQGECPADSCRPGACDGHGACQLAVAGTLCGGEASCMSTSVVQPADECDEAGACRPVASVSCETGFSCDGGECRMDRAIASKPQVMSRATTCASSKDCATEDGFYCMDGDCVSGANCSKTENAAYAPTGQKTSCAPSQCVTGSCALQCLITRRDCVEGYVCDDAVQACVPEDAFAVRALGGESISCAVTPLKRKLGWPWLLLAGTTLIALVARRRSER